MISPAKVKKLRRFPSARVAGFVDSSYITDAVSVAKKDMARPEIAELLKGERPLWPAGSCNGGMTMWVAVRTWYPFKRRRKAA
jgi:hypothetical protein